MFYTNLLLIYIWCLHICLKFNLMGFFVLGWTTCISPQKVCWIPRSQKLAGCPSSLPAFLEQCSLTQVLFWFHIVINIDNHFLLKPQVLQIAGYLKYNLPFLIHFIILGRAVKLPIVYITLFFSYVPVYSYLYWLVMFPRISYVPCYIWLVILSLLVNHNLRFSGWIYHL